MSVELGAGLLPITDEAVQAQRRLVRALADLGWERMSPAYAIPWSGQPVRHGTVEIPPGTAYSLVREARSAYGTRRFTIRALDLDFTLIGRDRLRRGGVGQAVYNIGYASDTGRLRPDVLLGEAWWRNREARPAPVLALLRTAYPEVRHRIEQVDTALLRFRVAAWGLDDAR